MLSLLNKVANQQGTYTQFPGDILHRGLDALKEDVGVQSTKFSPTENYQPTTSSTELTTEQKANVLTSLKTRLNSSDFSSTNMPEKL